LATSSDRRDIVIRDAVAADVPIFFEHQRDPDSNRMAGVGARDAEQHAAHWARILADDSLTAKTILYDGEVAGSAVSWESDGKRMVGYWIGQQFWGKGLATAALGHLVQELTMRPLHALVLADNAASLRVLRKHGFTVVGRRIVDGVEELDLELR
jgi:RimJ/RimL family protein N-acetyltransferase